MGGLTAKSDFDYHVLSIQVTPAGFFACVSQENHNICSRAQKTLLLSSGTFILWLSKQKYCEFLFIQFMPIRSRLSRK